MHSDIQESLARDLLRRILSTPCDSGGNMPFTPDEMKWCYQVTRERPSWSLAVLKEFGIK